MMFDAPSLILHPKPLPPIECHHHLMKIIPISVCFSFLLLLLLPQFHVRAQNNEGNISFQIPNLFINKCANQS